MKKILLLTFIAFLLRLIIIPITIHPDINGYNFIAYLISQEGRVVSFYDYLATLPHDNPLVKLYGVDVFIYPPPLYLLFATFMKILSPFYPWQTYQNMLLGFEKVFGDPNLPRLLFLLKGPFLVFDALGLILIWKLFDRPKEKFWASIAWLFNPLIFYTSYMMSQFDVLITLSLLAALYFHKAKKPYFAALSLGLGGLVKMFPLLLLPFYALSATQSLKERLKIFSLGIGVYIIGILPYLGSPGFRRSALFAPQTDKMFFAKIPVSGAEFLPVFLLGFGFLLWLAYFRGKSLEPWQWFFSILLLFFSVTHYHPNWFVWLSLPAIVFLIKAWPKSILPTILFLLSFVVIVFTFDASLNVGFFRMLNPNLLDFSFRNILARYYDPNLFTSISRGLFAATSIFVVSSFFVPAFSLQKKER